jgi:antitoxin (DNA-binding transcriptional repressor) of toxin-antitoxin stability system
MGDTILTLNVGEARSKLTQLDKLLKPGESLMVNKRGKAYARIELLGDSDPFEKALELLEALPEPEEKLRPLAQNYKSILYGRKKKNP